MNQATKKQSLSEEKRRRADKCHLLKKKGIKQYSRARGSLLARKESRKTEKRIKGNGSMIPAGGAVLLTPSQLKTLTRPSAMTIQTYLAPYRASFGGVKRAD